MMKDIKATLGDIPSFGASLKGVTVTQAPDITSHEQLEGRNLPDQHPASAITGIDEAIESALGEAKASGIFDGKDGADGKDGYTPRKGVDYFDGKDGNDGKDGYTPVKGIDYFDGRNGTNGKDGKTAYEYAQDGGYAGSEAEFAEKLAEATPTKLPNPNALTINGTSYDGSKAVTVNIEGGSGGETVYATITYNIESGETTSTMTAAEMIAACKSGCTVVAVIMTSGDVIDVREGAAVLVPHGANLLITDIITKTDRYHVLIECTDSSNPENGKIKVQHSSMAAQALIGTTDEITPTQVAAAVAESRPVRISHTDEWGMEYLFTSFNILNNLVIGEILVTAHYDNSGTPYATFPYLKGIMGDNERWVFGETLRMATVEGLPTTLPNPHKLTINGKVYDGSEEVTVNIEGGTDAEWVATPEISGGSVQMETNLNFTSKYHTLNPHWKPIVGYNYDIYWNGTKYTCAIVESSGEAFVGNRSLLGSSYPDTGEPFLFTGWALTNPELTSVQKATATAETVSLRIETERIVKYNKLPEVYLPECVVKSVNGTAPDANGNVNVAGGSGGGTSIDVTAKVGQTIVVEEVDANGKPTKWKAADFQERTHWSEFKEIQPLVTVTPVYNEYFGVAMGNLGDFKLTVGHKYKVTFDGIEYVCEAFIASMSGISAPAIGNTLVAGGADTGEPFAIFRLDTDAAAGIIFLDMNPHTVRIEGETVTPIHAKYLENVRPYYVELTISEDNPVCHERVNNLEPIFLSGREIILRLSNIPSVGNTVSYCNLPLAMWGKSLIGIDSDPNYNTFIFALGTGQIILAPQSDGTYTASAGGFAI